MIASVRGKLTVRTPEAVIVEVQGVGYRVHVSQETFSKLPAVGEAVFLWIHTQVREDDISLFGFLEDFEKKIFQKLIHVNGVGPKLALTILSGISASELITAILREDLVRLTSISGVGKKTAERLFLDLKDKVLELSPQANILPLHSIPLAGVSEELLSALTNLGYPRLLAERTLAHMEMNDTVPFEVLLKQALKSLSEGKVHGR